MSNLSVRNIYGKDGSPVGFPNGFVIGSGAGGAANHIGVPGRAGFGVSVCAEPLPAGMLPLPGYADPLADNYGNYVYTDGSVMVWIPAYFYKWGTGANGVALNAVDIKSFGHFASVAAANAAGYALHRAFYDGGAVQPGVFVDKYLCSNNAGIASSLKNGNPLSSAGDHSPFSTLSGAPGNNFAGAVLAAKTRGVAFFCNTRFIFAALAMLAYAHARASSSTAFCAWWDAAGVSSFPKGCNNNALGDANDGDIRYQPDGYSSCAKTGSANLFARTTHNGQNSGITDLNGNMWEITPGLTSDGTHLYVLKTTAKMQSVTAGNTLATDLWGAAGIAALYDNLGTTYEGWRETGFDRSAFYGSVTQVFAADTSGNAWSWAGAGGMLAGGDGGTNAFGNDQFVDSKLNDLCPASGGGWLGNSTAGVWTFYLAADRGANNPSFGFRAALYL